MGETIGLNRKVAQIWTDVGSIGSTVENGRVNVTTENATCSFVATEYTTNATNSVLLSPTSTTVEIVIENLFVTTAGSSGYVEVESSSTSIGFGGVFAKLYASKFNIIPVGNLHVHLGIGQDLRVTSTVGTNVFVGITYTEE